MQFSELYSKQDSFFKGDMGKVKAYKSDAETAQLKKNAKYILKVVLLGGSFLLASANDAVLYIPFLWIFSLLTYAFAIRIVDSIVKKRKNGQFVFIKQQRKRITLAIQKREARVNAKAKELRDAELAQEEAKLEALRQEEADLDARLKAALEPIDYDKPEEFKGNWVKMKSPVGVASVKAQPKQEAPVKKSSKGKPSKKITARKGGNVNKQAKQPAKRKPKKGFKKVNIEI